MRTLSLVGILISAGCFAFADDAPQPSTVSAKIAKPGDTFTITGVGLSDKKVDEIYLTDHKFDMKMKVLEQQETSITVRVPPFAKPGRMQLLLLTAGEDPKLLEQPLYVLIEEPTTEITEVKKDAPKPAQQEQKQ
jgi:hypothetical protein